MFCYFLFYKFILFSHGQWEKTSWRKEVFWIISPMHSQNMNKYFLFYSLANAFGMILFLGSFIEYSLQFEKNIICCARTKYFIVFGSHTRWYKLYFYYLSRREDTHAELGKRDKSIGHLIDTSRSLYKS